MKFIDSILYGDCLDVLKKVPDNSVDLIVTSPPYADQRKDVYLGICYGKVRTASSKKGYLKLVGQNFWTFISGNKDLYKQIIEPIGYRAKEHNDAYHKALGNVSNRLEGEFIKKFCNKHGEIKWDELVEATCGNYDLNKHGFNF